MSIETLLEAAKFVEWSAQIGYGARANDDEPDVQTVGKNGQSGSAKAGASVTGVSSSPVSSPGSSSPVASSGKHIDEGDDKRSGTREVHNKLEKNRRAHLKECFDNLRETIPNMDDKKMKPSNLSILQGALRYLQALKRKERDLEYETEKLARQKIQYQDKLVKLKGVYSHWKVEKSLKVEEKDDEREEDMDTDDEDCASVSTSTSTASEAEEEERKSRAQSPELKLSQVVHKTEMADQKVEPPLVRTDQSSDQVITSGPFVISRRIVTHVPITTAAGQQQVPTRVPIVVKQHSQQGLTQKKVVTPPKTMTLPPAQFQPKTVTVPAAQFQQQPRGIGGIRQPMPAFKEYVSPQEPNRVAPPQLTRRQVVTQFMIRPQIRRATSQKMMTTTQKLVVTTQSTALQPVLIHETIAQSQPIAQSLTYAAAQPVITPQTTAKQIVAPLTSDQTQQQLKVTSQTIVSVKPKVTSHQVIRHSTAVSAVQEHLKNKAQSKQFNQHQKESSTIPHTTPTMESLTSKQNVALATTAAVAAVTTSGGVSRQTVSQLLGKQQAMVVRQPVRRTDNKFVVQRVTRHPFSPRSQTVDIMPKSSKLVTSSDTSVTQVSYPLSEPVNAITCTEPQTVHVTSAMTSTVSVSSGGAVANVTNAIPTCSVALQHATPPPGLDVRGFIAGHNTMLPSFQHYLPQGSLGTAMIRPNLSNPGMLTANATLLNQAMLANTRSLTSDLTSAGINDKTQVKLHSPLTNPSPFLSPSITQQAKVSGVSQGTLPSPSHVAPITPGHSWVSPGLTLQPALTQVLFTQPPIAAYTVANSSHPLVNPSVPHTVIRHPLVPTVGIPQNITTVGVAGSSVSQTTVGVTLPPVVTIGAVAYPMLNTNRAVVTAPTYTTLSFGPLPPYRFPFTNQVPLISPVALTSSNSGVPVTSAANQTVSNGRTSNGVIVHALSVPTTTPVSNAWLNSSTISNGLPTKGLSFPITTSVVTSSTSAVAIATTPAAVMQPASSTTQDTGVTNSQVAATTT